MVTQDIYATPNLEDEDTSIENWRNLQNNSKKKKSIYLTPNREILLRNMDSRSKTKTIGFIKNCSNSNFMSIKLNNNNYVLSNTCSFDTIIQMLAVACCDSTTYSNYVLQKKKKNTLWNLILIYSVMELPIKRKKNASKYKHNFFLVNQWLITLFIYQ